MEKKRENNNKICEIEKELRIVVLTTLALFICDKWREMIKVVKGGAGMMFGQWRISCDYHKEKKAVEVCNTMSKRIDTFYSEIGELLENINFKGKKDIEDPYEYWAEQTEIARDILNTPTKNCMTILSDVFRKAVKPLDGVMFHNVIRIVYLSGMYTNLLDSFTKNMTPEELKPFRRLDPAPMSFELSKHLKLRNRDGKILAFAYYGEEDDIQAQLRKKYYLNEKSESFKAFYPAPLFCVDEVARVGYEFEKSIFSFENIAKIRKSSELTAKDYYNIFKMHHDCPCLSSFEVYYSCILFKRKAYKRCLELLPALKDNIPLYRGKKTTPVVGFVYNPYYKKGEPKVILTGIWNSMGEAARECGEKFINIAAVARANNCKKRIDKGEWTHDNHKIWLSIDVYERLLRSLIAKGSDEDFTHYYINV